MIKDTIIALLLFAVITVTASAEIFVDCDETVKQGNIIPVYIVSDSSLENITIAFNRNNKTYGKFRGYRLSKDDCEISDDYECYIVLLSVASDAYPDIYKLDIRWQRNGYAERRLFDLAVEKSIFKKEEIPLSKGLTTLRKDESERRKRETRAIIKLYRKFNVNNQFVSSDFDYPLKGSYPVTSHFGDRRVFVYDDGDISRSLHNGIDYAAVKGTAVYASADGKVVFSGNRLITGNSIIIEHIPGLYSVYYHLDKAIVFNNDFVEKGVKIGEVGSSGISTGNHLHWEIRNQGIAVDPQQFISQPLIDKDRILRHINDSFSDIDRGR